MTREPADREGGVAVHQPALQEDPIRSPRRLAAVRATRLLDTSAEPAFDDLTRMAATVIGVPYAFATIVDDARSFWKSCFGIPADVPHQNTVDESFCQYVVRSQTELIAGDTALDVRTRDNPSIASMGVRAWAGFPLLAPDGEVVGSFCVVDTQPREWSVRDVEILRTLSAAASHEIALRAAIENERTARVHAETLAHTLQESLLPPTIPNIPGLDVAACFHPAGSGVELVGDFYDVLQSRDGVWSFMVGDVCGKGITAAKVAALARYTVGAAAVGGASPAQALTWLNETLRARRPSVDVFLTALHGSIERTATHCVVTLACAGHGAPLLRHADGRAEEVSIRGPLVGIFADFTVDEIELRLAPGESLVLYTDGVSDAGNGAQVLGDDAVRTLLESLDPAATAATIAEHIKDAAIAVTAGEMRDDVAVLVIRVPK